MSNQVNHGTWRDEESEKLKQLAEHSRTSSKMSGQDKIDWDWVVERFGASRTRHQILIKATHLVSTCSISLALNHSIYRFGYPLIRDLNPPRLTPLGSESALRKLKHSKLQP
jgi:hypothetical protein